MTKRRKLYIFKNNIFYVFTNCPDWYFLWLDLQLLLAAKSHHGQNDDSDDSDGCDSSDGSDDNDGSDDSDDSSDAIWQWSVTSFFRATALAPDSVIIAIALAV